MSKINLKRYYNVDIFIELPDKIIHALESMHKYERALAERDRYNRTYAMPCIDFLQSKWQSPVDEVVCCQVQMRKLMSCLPEKQKRRLILRYVYGYTVKQIAKAEGVSAAAVCSSISLAKSFIRNFYE